MSHEKLTYEDLLQIIELVKSSEQWSEFHLKVGDLEVDFKRPPRSSAVASAAATDSQAAMSAATSHQRAGHVGGGEVVNDLPSTATASHAAAPIAPVRHSANAVLVKSPMVGTFYRAPEPGAPPFIDIGDKVDADTIVCIIEVMKLMNSIPAGASGVATQILVADGEPVEYGQILMVIEPR
jgi:acetyl-CoA carboxylase biotin carboxyl carrier protein